MTINGSLVSATDWIQGAVEILAAPTVITGDAALTPGADTLSATGTVDIAGSASLTQGADTSSGAGAVAIVGSANLTQGADTLTSDGSVAIALAPYRRHRYRVAAAAPAQIPAVGRRFVVPPSAEAQL